MLPAGPSHVDALIRGNQAMALETEGKRLDDAVLRRGVESVLADSNKGHYFVAVREDEVVGQLMLTYEWSDWRAGQVHWIQSVYVAPAARRLGVYRTLHEYVVRDARSRGAVAIRLYVERHNTAAQRTYSRVGMKSSIYDLMEQEDF